MFLFLDSADESRTSLKHVQYIEEPTPVYSMLSTYSLFSVKKYVCEIGGSLLTYETNRRIQISFLPPIYILVVQLVENL